MAVERVSRQIHVRRSHALAIGGPGWLPKPPASLGRLAAPPDLPAWGARPPEPPCVQARMARTAREHEVLMAQNMTSSYTDVQDKYCGHCYDIHPIRSQCTKVVVVGDSAFKQKRPSKLVKSCQCRIRDN